MPLNADPMPEGMRGEQPATLLRSLMVAFAVEDFEALRMKKKDQVLMWAMSVIGRANNMVAWSDEAARAIADPDGRVPFRWHVPAIPGMYKGGDFDSQRHAAHVAQLFTDGVVIPLYR